MTKENITRLYEHFKRMESGDFTQTSFSTEHTSFGKLTPEKVALIRSDGRRNREKLEKKFPWLTGKETTSPDVLDKIAENKSKGKK